MKLLIFILLIHTIAIFPQQKIENIMDISSSEKVHDITKHNQCIISQIRENQKEYFLINLNNPSAKEFIMSTTDYKNNYVKFSNNEKFILIKNKRENRSIINIYNVDTKEIIELSKVEGNVVSAAIIDLGKILFQLREPNSEPKIFLFNQKNGEEKFITIGIGEEWAPNGKYFFVKKINEERRWDKSKTEKSNQTNKSKKGFINIYNDKGIEELSLVDFAHVTIARWSPDSKKIVIKSLGQNGFNIIYLNQSNGLKIKNKEYFTKKFDSNMEYINDPTWSPDSKYLFYSQTVQDGHRVLSTSIWSLNIENKEDLKIENLESNNPINTITVSDNYNLFISQERSEEIIKINSTLTKGD